MIQWSTFPVVSHDTYPVFKIHATMHNISNVLTGFHHVTNGSHVLDSCDDTVMRSHSLVSQLRGCASKCTPNASVTNPRFNPRLT